MPQKYRKPVNIHQMLQLLMMCWIEAVVTIERDQAFGFRYRPQVIVAEICRFERHEEDVAEEVAGSLTHAVAGRRVAHVGPVGTIKSHETHS